MHDFTPLPALLGGILIGLSATLLLASHGVVAGISGLYGSLLVPGRATVLRGAFVLGLVLAGLVAATASPGSFGAPPARSVATVAAAGLLVGFGTRLGNGCTSGHGVCGLSRLSVRSLVATLVFMTFGAGTVFVVDHLLGGAS